MSVLIQVSPLCSRMETTPALLAALGENSCASASTGTPSSPTRTTAALIGCLIPLTMTCFCQPGFSYQDNSCKPLASAIRSGLPS